MSLVLVYFIGIVSIVPVYFSVNNKNKHLYYGPKSCYIGDIIKRLKYQQVKQQRTIIIIITRDRDRGMSPK